MTSGAMADEALLARDLASLWHPASHFDDHALLPPVPIASAHGPWLVTTAGARILDAIASWWTCVHGHCEPAIVEAIAAQARTLDHVMFAGFTHAPAVALAERLLALAGPPLSRVFFADSGADAIEIAVKLSLQHHRQAGAPARRRVAALAHGYHGETLGALALCGNEPYRAPFAGLLHDALFLPTPEISQHRHGDLLTDAGADDAACEQAIALLERHADELAALVVEPLVQCAGRMRMTGSGFLRRIADTAQSLGIHLVTDEIAVGLGRSGRALAGHWCGLRPDMVCVGKGLSGGALPLSAVLVAAPIEAAFHGAPDRAFAHSHTFCGNPIATAAACASVELLRARSGAQLESTIAALDDARAEVAAACRAVQASRQVGTIVAFDLAPHTRAAPDGRTSLSIRRAALRHGLLLRPLGDTLYWMPPLWIDREAVAHLTAGTIASIHEVLGG